MNVNELRNELAIRCKNGLPFILAANIVWSMVLVIFLLPYEIASKNILTLFSTGITFPLAILITKVIKADWKVSDNPLGMLGLYINLAQLMYFPILFFAFVKAQWICNIKINNNRIDKEKQTSFTCFSLLYFLL